MSSDNRKTIVFICTANASRSQMAEGWANYLKGDEFIAFSAGVRPARLSSRATEVMAEVGVDISGHYSKGIDDLRGVDFDYIVTVCDNAREHCPVFRGGGKVLHKPFGDPANVIGTREQMRDTFRRVRDEIREFVVGLPGCLG